MKTVKYYIDVEVADFTVVTRMEISKSEYWQQLDNLKKIVEETKDNEYDKAEIYSSTADSDMSTTYLDSLAYACSHVTLIRHECKPGYRFVSKRQSSKQKSDCQ